MLAGDWYDLNFNFNQGLVSALLIYSLLAVSTDNYVIGVCAVACGAIGFNFIDLHLGLSSEAYGKVLSLINAIEVAILLSLGLRSYVDGLSRDNHYDIKRGFAFYIYSFCVAYWLRILPKNQKTKG